ncbi:MAG: hypothetical protein A2901_05475 [Elusimicrobia bacterium RIFCSPLOWO2_01_FULL_54_10]|nr:MAG: hypothetical protein A2901_05475 [Elusimicrobia bacterium RIFCSPLOWO2_01_FULL_54_10]
MELKKYKMSCDDADPESQCMFSTEGSSVDEVYQEMIAHEKAVHPKKINSLDPKQLRIFENEMRDFIEKNKRFSPYAAAISRPT